MALLALLVVCSLPLFYRLGEAPVFGDETLSVRVAVRALHWGHWAPLREGWTTFVDKPPMHIWASIAGMKLLGENELGARLGTGLAALLLCGVIRRRSRHLRFPAHTGSLRPAASEPLTAETS